MLDKRKEMARLRAKLSYREAKAQRQNKIKSKKYVLCCVENVTYSSDRLNFFCL